MNIRFARDVETDLRPSPITGFAKAAHTVAKITSISSAGPDQRYEGYLLYVKACLIKPLSARVSTVEEARASDYQTYHPAFPQESTADQFFDPPQWNAYYTLGRRLARSALRAGDVLGKELTRRQLLRTLKQAYDEAVAPSRSCTLEKADVQAGTRCSGGA